MAVIDTSNSKLRKTFSVILIKPSHYDDDGYVIQWLRSSIPSNSLATVYGLMLDCAERRILGEDVNMDLVAYDETNTRIKAKSLVHNIRAAGGMGLVALVGVQSNQFPRALDIARQFREAGIQVCIGGFHVSGCLAMLPQVPTDLNEALDLGISLFAGELEEGRLDKLLKDAFQQKMQPIYNYLDDLPGLDQAPIPFLPVSNLKRTAGMRASFDAGRGCPFLCSFCTIINVQGRKSRYRPIEKIEKIIRRNAEQGVLNFFISDDNFARNKQWESIFDCIIQLREEEDFNIDIIIQVDTMCHKIDNFVEKAGHAGVNRVFIGLENINPDSLKTARKGQNRITEYRAMFQAWHSIGALTYAGYILGFPNDTPETIERDIKIIQRELPVDLLEFFILTPLPGSQDHQTLHSDGAYLDPDMNNYDLEHVTSRHPHMSEEIWKQTYLNAWDWYYTPDHVETVIRRAKTSGFEPKKMMTKLLSFYACIKLEKMHPLEGGIVRRKYRHDRRPGLPIENPLIFYPRYVIGTVDKYVRFFWMTFQYKRILKRVERDNRPLPEYDIAMQPVHESEFEKLEMYTATDAARVTVESIRRKNANKAKPVVVP